VISRGQLLIGVDFSSAPSARKPITVALGLLSERAAGTLVRLDEVRELPSLAAFEAFLVEPGGWIGGFDLPFGQPRELIEHQGWPTAWPAFVDFFCQEPRERLREVFRRWCQARPAGSKFAWRKADRPAGSSPAMRWTNPPVAWMMHAGIGRMVAADLEFPAHRHPARRRSGTVRQRKIALEAYPAFTARKVCRRSYKSDTPAAWTAERHGNRAAILRALEQGTAGLDVSLEVGRSWRERLIEDGRGDLLDAVICSLQAAHAARRRGFGLPRKVDPLEGWIASVPPPET
jgi:hypothetical protein